MPAVKLPVTRLSGRALLIGSESCRAEPLSQLVELGIQCSELDDPYAAMLELCRHPRQYQAVVLSLLSLYREELRVIAAIKRRFPHIEIWLTHTDGRAAALAEAMRCGADGLLTAEGLHRTASTPEAGTSISPFPPPFRQVAMDDSVSSRIPPVSRYNEFAERNGEPVLTADELRALL